MTNVAVLTGIPPGFWAGLVVLCALAAVIVLNRGREAIAGTTLGHAWAWTLCSLATLTACEVFRWWSSTFTGGQQWDAALRLIAATGTFCPVMAVLGARRPQHRAWQFVVVSMWAILALPALEAIFLGRPQAMDVGPVRGWFLWLMLLVNLLTYLPTRFAAAAVLVAMGQLLLLAPFLPGLGERGHNGAAAAGAALFFAVAAVRTACGFPRAHPAPSEFERRWCSFRDMFGTMWALRVIERVNAAARMYEWPLSLTWTGFYFHHPEDDWATLSPKTERELRQTLDNLLRRFLS